jgi:LuxR family maltose regulon positive regulatory protein
LEKLKDGYCKTVTLIQAPAGFGKTTAVAQWYQQHDGPKGWMAVDELDNDFPKFVSYAYAMMQKSSIPDTDSPIFDDWSKITPANAEKIVAYFSKHLSQNKVRPVIVLDDFHLLTEPSIIHGLERFLKYIENRVHLVFISRSHISLTLNSLLLSDQVQLINAQDLKFNEVETRSFFAAQSDETYLNFKPTLDELSGWPAGMQLFQMARKNELSLSQEQAMMGDYILSEIIRHMPEPNLTTAMKAAVSRRFNLALLKELAPEVNLNEIVMELESRHSLITMTGTTDRWYRFHNLFRQALIDHYRRSDPVEYQNTEQLCAQWWLKHAYYSEAAEHLVHSDNEAAISEFLIEHGWSFYRNGQYQLLDRCFNYLPATLIANNATLTLTYAWLSLINEDPKQADHCIHLSENALNLSEKDEASYSSIKSVVAVIFDDYFAAQRWGEHSLSLSVPPRPWERCHTFLSIAEARINQCDFEGAKEALAIANDICQSERYITLLIQVMFLLAEIDLATACWQSAEKTLANALEFAKERGLSKLFSIDHLQRSYSRVLRLQGKSNESQLILDTMDISDRPLGDYWQFPILIEQLLSMLLEGSADQAAMANVSKQIEYLSTTTQFSVKWQLPADRALILYWAGTRNTKQLKYLINRYEPLSFQTPRFSLNARLNLGLAQLAMQDVEPAAKTIQECLDGAQLVKYEELTIICEVALSIICSLKTRSQVPDTQLLKLSQDPCGSFLLKTLSPLFTHNVKSNKRSKPHLTKSELRVSQLHEQGKTNREVADELGIALATVRSHIKSINRKQSISKTDKSPVN